MQTKNYGEYYLGLDMGTSSIGWAVTDLKYNLLKFKGKSMWGIRLFDEAQTAAGTRTNRSARRRLERKSWRVGLVQEIFAKEIAKVDKAFFIRLKESRLWEIDKSEDNKQPFALFADKKYRDVDFHRDYPTIYHLRKALIDGKQALDVRLVYLAVQHIIKHRGHFLFDGLDAGHVTDFASIYEKLQIYIQDELGIVDWSCQNTDLMQEVLKNNHLGISAKEKVFKTIMPLEDAQQKAVVKALCGGSFKLADLFVDESLNEGEVKSFSFAKDNYDEALPKFEAELGEKVEGLALFKAVYDWSLLVGILKGHKYLSDAKIEVYEEHASDLHILKELLKANSLPYNDVLRGKAKGLYQQYIDGKINQEDFCKALKKVLDGAFKAKFTALKTYEDAKNDADKFLYKVANGQALPKQTSKDNGVIPMQIHSVELEAILKNAEKYLPFLSEKDANGISNADKLMEIFKFRVPYYIGPLAGTKESRAKKRCWVVRTADKVYPWNFDKVVDREASAEKFITNMTAKCTYLLGADVLPKQSLLYTEFMVRNELNNLKVDGERLAPEVLERIYKDLIETPQGNSKVTLKRIADWLKRNNLPCKDLSGIDGEVKTPLRSYKDMRNIFGEKYVQTHTDEMENIIKWITLFCDEKSMLVRKIQSVYPDVTAAQLKKLKQLKYSDWGRLSKEFLASENVCYIDDSTGEMVTVISALRNTNKNLMELLSSNNEYGFMQCVEEYNGTRQTLNGKIRYEDLEDLYVSPSVKRCIWQTITIVEEIRKIIGHDPKKIFIEVAREEGEKKRTTSRLQRLQDLYANCAEDCLDLKAALENTSEERLRSDKLYLYYTQMGMSMYSNTRIDLSSLLSDGNYCDIDHIYPRSKTKDDSINNRVLVLKKENMAKGDVYPLSSEIRNRMAGTWKMLLEKGLIEQPKYERLMRSNPLTNEELASFIARQLVETRQSTKAVAELFKAVFKDTEIVYAKAGNASDFRQQFGFIKCRDINDLHHAKDAYINIVVGNVFNTRFTRNPLNFIKNLKAEDKYNLNPEKLYNCPVKGAWTPGDNGTIKTVKATMKRNNILFTRLPLEGKGQLFDLTLQKKNAGQLSLKKNMPIERYGGYNSLSTAHFLLAEYKDKKGKVTRSILAVPIIYRNAKEEELAAFFANDIPGMKDFKVIIPCIKKYSLIEVNGFPMHISGKTGTRLKVYTAAQLILDDEYVAYYKKLMKQQDRILCYEVKVNESKEIYDKQIAQNRLDSLLSISGISREKNMKLYDYMLIKHRDSIYKKRPNNQSESLVSQRPVFEMLSVGEQIKVLLEILNLFKCGSYSADFKLLKKAPNSGVTLVNCKISDKESFKLITQSPTGLFTKEIDLLKI